ncbi:hypothetical protein AB0J38_42845 [Streptomyces sp. NPDC050095]|uniref:hypothetical protein n=1 Tax=unclassified Streptomyces TaxID=2593676 RepID=UPI003431A11E
MAATDDRNRRLFSGLTSLFTALLGLASVLLIGRALAGSGPHYSALQVATAALGLGVTAASVWLVIKARRSSSWRPLVIACGACVGWLIVGALVGRM